jgi:OmcA/MtrC family decaheme c-type cytochrome
VAIQFDNAKVALNPTYDFQPATGAVDQIVRGQVAATASCNQCHGALALHGGGRIEVDYCVTCHNPGSSDANSGNSVAFSEMIHKIHRGADLPSVRAGGSYGIYGFNDSLQDYSAIRYPQDIRHCTECHAGSGTEDGRSVATSQGDNWSEFPTRRACGACHDDVDFGAHFGGQPDDSDCRSCHSLGGAAGSVAAVHAIPTEVAARQFAYEIVDISATAAGASPIVDFRIVDPTNGNAPYDIKTHPAFTQGGGASRLAVTLAWSTTDYTNTRPGATSASTVSINALTQSIALDNNVFRVVSTVPIPDGLLAPFVAATGSGAATLEGHPALDVDSDAPGVETIPVRNAVRYFSIDEPTGVAVPRRQVVEIARCNVCHAQLALHGDNRTDNIDGCVTCHNPRNTDRGVRDIAVTVPSDGKQEESLDFKTMIHGIHAAAERQSPLQIVGFGGFTTHVYDSTTVHYPGRLADCATCHTGDSFALPLNVGVLGTTTDTGSDRNDPTDDEVSSPMSAVCASCHDNAAAKGHMVSNGGDFATTQAFLDSGVTAEGCVTCHGSGAVVDVAVAHGVSP